MCFFFLLFLLAFPFVLEVSLVSLFPYFLACACLCLCVCVCMFVWKNLSTDCPAAAAAEFIYWYLLCHRMPCQCFISRCLHMHPRKCEPYKLTGKWIMIVNLYWNGIDCFHWELKRATGAAKVWLGRRKTRALVWMLKPSLRARKTWPIVKSVINSGLLEFCDLGDTLVGRCNRMSRVIGSIETVGPVLET